MRLAFVVPRYGKDVVGGAETQIREYAERLTLRGHTVEVLTTCARDHYSWRNELPEGTTYVDGVAVHRFPVSRPRDHVITRRLQQALDAGLDLGVTGETMWLDNAGDSQALLEALGDLQDVDALLFAPYLFPTTVRGARVRPDRTIVIPCLHDEAYARFSTVQATLRGVAGLIFNTAAERQLACSLLGDLPPNRIVGEGFEEPGALDGKVLGDELAHHAVAYAGRRETGKNYHRVLEYVTLYSRALSRRGPLSLLAMGGGPITPPAVARDLVIDLGFVDERRKLEAMAASVATIQLSRNESFSRVLMESWLAGTPVVVDAGCAVTRDHCVESGGGVWVRSAEEFAVALDLLRSDDGLRERLARSGGRYVRDRYSWPAVLDRLEDAITHLVS